MQREKLRVIIVGGGIAGFAVAAALQLKSSAVEYVVIEQWDDLRNIGLGMSVTRTGRDGLRLLGLFDDFAKLAKTGNLWAEPEYRYAWPVIRDGKTGKIAAIHEDEEMSGVHRSMFLQMMASKIPPQCLKLGTRFVRYEQEEDGTVIVHCVDVKTGQAFTERGDLLLGCDGLRSPVRKQMQDGKDYVRWTGAMAFRAVFDKAEQERLNGRLNASVPTIWCGKDVHLLHYPISADHNNAIVYVFDRSKPEDKRELDSNDAGNQTLPKEALTKHLAGFGPEVTRTSELFGATVERWPLYELRLPSYSSADKRVVLCGDSSSVTIPSLGTPCALSIESAVVLAELLSKYPSGRYTLESLIKTYEAVRRPRCELVSELCRDAAQLYEHETPPADIQEHFERLTAQAWHYDYQGALKQALEYLDRL